MTQIPTPGNVLNVAGIPDDLRRINQWIVWKPVLRGKKLTKVPVSYAFPTGDPIDAQDQLYWGTFDEVCEVVRNDPRFGIGLVLRGTGLICIDYDDHEGDDKDAVALGASYMHDLLQARPTFSEYSVSGKGQHTFYRGVLPWGRITGEVSQLNWEIYAQQFIAITGMTCIGSAPYIADGQDIIDSWKIPEPITGAGATEPTVALGRRLDYTDAEVISTMMVRRASIFAMMSSTADLADRSTAFAQIVGDLDKITGDPNQVDRIIRKCPFMCNGYNAEKYEQQPKWLAKYNCSNMLEYWMKQAREDNKESIPYAEVITPERMEFLKRVGDAIAYRTTVEAPAELKQELTTYAATERTINTDVQGDSPIAQLTFMLEENIPGNYQELTPPPGIAGAFVDALCPMLTGPRLTYMLPAIISTFAGYLGQTFKTPGFEMGLVTHFVIAGQMNTGKTSTMSVLNKAIDLALSGWHRNPHKPTSIMPSPTEPLTDAKRRIIETRAVSVQGLFDAISMLGSACWFADEAEAQMATMSSGNERGDAFKAFYKQTFDKSGAMDAASLDVSRESAKMGVVPILNMNLPTYFSCTAEVFETLREKELVDGTYSRVNMIYDETPMDSVADDELLLQKGLPGPLMNLVQKIAFLADDTASSYDQAGLKALQREVMNPKGEKSHEDLRRQIEQNKRAGLGKTKVMQFTPAAAELKRTITAVCRQVGHDANPHIGKWPSHYQIMARTDILPVLVAGVLASLDMIANWNVNLDKDSLTADWREKMPQVWIGENHLRWAFEFVMHWRLHFFKAWDQGKIAVQMSDDEVVMLRVLRRALNSKEAQVVDGTWWVPQGYVVRQANQVSPFKTADKVGASQGRSGGTTMARQTIATMVEHGTIIRADAKDLQLSTKGFYLSIVSKK